MDLSSPLTSISPGLDSSVLTVLAATESALSASQISRLTRRGTRPGQAPVLDRLVAHGLVLAEPAARGHLYRFNRDHVLASGVLTALESRRVVLARLTWALGQWDPLPIHASLFGSFARGEADETSDIDIFLVVPDSGVIDDPPWEGQVHELVENVRRWTGNRLQPVVVDRARLKQLARRDEPLFMDVVDDGVLLFGDPVSLLTDVVIRRRHITG